MVSPLGYEEGPKKNNKDRKTTRMARLRKGEVVKRRIEARDLTLRNLMLGGER
jgi:hypothetical protein